MLVSNNQPCIDLLHFSADTAKSFTLFENNSTANKIERTDESCFVHGQRVCYLMKTFSLNKKRSLMTWNCFCSRKISLLAHKKIFLYIKNVHSSYIFPVSCGKIFKNDFSNILSIDNSILSRWNFHCSWTKRFLCLETFIPQREC